ncbi:MAG: serine hydrolase [Chloroflexota bacterium]
MDESHTAFPMHGWPQYVSVEAAGYSAARLQGVSRFCEEIGSAALLILHDGVVLHAWGDLLRRFECRSIRKSYLSALFGIYWDRGVIELDKRLAELGIDDEPPLTPAEREATVHDLLSARSGVYHLAAYEGPVKKPERGSHPAGSRWLYNNWDFNTLYTIFEQETGQSPFDAFRREIARPLGMSRLRQNDSCTFFEPERSQHPAYLFRTCALDMARFGLLYLRQGRWRDQQILSKEWVTQSTSNQSLPGEEGYGYMWWVPRLEGGLARFAELGLFEASGTGGQKITILPEEKLVVVHLCDTYRSEAFVGKKYWELLDKILGAKNGDYSKTPKLMPFQVQTDWQFNQRASVEVLLPYTGKYELAPNLYVDVELIGEQIFLSIEPTHFPPTVVLSNRKGGFVLEDIGIELSFQKYENDLIIEMVSSSGKVWSGSLVG